MNRAYTLLLGICVGAVGALVGEGIIVGSIPKEAAWAIAAGVVGVVVGLGVAAIIVAETFRLR